MIEQQEALRDLLAARRMLEEDGAGASRDWLEAARSYVALCEDRLRRAEDAVRRAQSRRDAGVGENGASRFS